jgi:hypothetical protein
LPEKPSPEDHVDAHAQEEEVVHQVRVGGPGEEVGEQQEGQAPRGYPPHDKEEPPEDLLNLGRQGKQSEGAESLSEGSPKGFAKPVEKPKPPGYKKDILGAFVAEQGGENDET